METKEIQNDCLEVLRAFDLYAKNNNLKYYMAGGTLLGAVRHQGFIPWDDDVDLMMPRKDYEFLIHHFHNDRYEISSCETDGTYHTPFARVWDKQTRIEWKTVCEKEIGVFIDVFPMDGFPDGNIMTYVHLWHLKFYRALVNSSIREKFLPHEKYLWCKRIMKKVFRRSGNYYSQKLNRVAQKYDYDKCSYVGVKTTSLHLFREKNSKEIFQKVIYLPFEDMELPSPVGYDVYLKHLYGNYRVLPPEEQRHSEHEFVIYKIDRSTRLIVGGDGGGVIFQNSFDAHLCQGRCA